MMSGYIAFKEAVRVGKYGKIAVLVRLYGQGLTLTLLPMSH